jgi:hypothetical protein
MKRVFPWLVFAAVGGAAAGSTFACGSDDDGGGGRAGTGGAAGGLLEGGGASGGSGGSGGTGGTPSNPLGAACETNADCGADLTCVTSIGGQNIPGGLCTVTCGADSADPDAECTALRTGAFCIGVGPAGAEEPWCVEPCTEGQSTACHGRQNAACFGLVSTDTQEPVGNACIPLCSNDGQCAPMVCDGESGFCSDVADPGTLPIGSSCDANSLVDQCANGFCAEFDDAGNAFCTAYCRGAVSCGWAGPTSNTSPAALCALTAAATPGVADLGFCAATCRCNSECAQSLFICEADPSLSTFGLAGICFRSSADAGGGGVVTCPGAGGAGGAGGASGGTGGDAGDTDAATD